ncbi:MAG: AN1-type zinc finger domain-containing protein [Nanoarchaeota archaeon]|nr:AN1-type zinc finger domain-containing protein [Nanoarchaeota archaeon]
MGTFSKRWDREEDENDREEYEEEDFDEHAWNQRRMGRRRKPRPKNKCDSCEKEINHIPFVCNYCDESHCENCRLPEEHGCNGDYGRINKIKNRRKKVSIEKKFKNEQLDRDIEKFTKKFKKGDYIKPTPTIEQKNQPNEEKYERKTIASKIILSIIVIIFLIILLSIINQEISIEKIMEIFT